MAKTELTPKEAEATALGEYKFGFHDDFEPVFRTQRGLNEETSCARSRRTSPSPSG